MATNNEKREIVVRLVVSGDLAGLTDEQLVGYAAAHLEYEGVHGLSEDQERQLDNADFSMAAHASASALVAAEIDRLQRAEKAEGEEAGA